MKEIMENIKNFFKGLAQALRRFMGQDIPDAELLEDEYNNEYFYRKLNGFNELNPESRSILDNAMEAVVADEKQVSMQEALKMAKKSKLKSNAKSDKTLEVNKPSKEKKQTREEINVDRDL